MSVQPIAIGIDLGTTFSAAAFLDASGKPETIRNAEGELMTPSVVFFDHSGFVVGREAVNAGQLEPLRLARFMKRSMGERYYPKEIRGELLPPEVLQAAVLKKLKTDVEAHLGSFPGAVITVPAYFNEPCRKATMDAGRLAGIEVLDIINEPTAAAICFGVQHGFLTREGQAHQLERVLIYDLGGGTFDVTLMEIEGGDHRALATGGDVYLGGADWDQRLVDLLADAIQRQCADPRSPVLALDPRQDPIVAEALLHRAIETKHALTARKETTVLFSHEGKRAKIGVSREEFEERTADLLDRTLLTVRKVLREAGLQSADLTRLLLVGGSTRMPMVQRMLERETKLTADRSLSPDEAVAHGAAIYAGLALKSGAERIKGITLTNVSSHNLGILGHERQTGRLRRSLMIPANTPLPATVQKTFPLSTDGQRSVKAAVIEGGDDSGNNSTAIGRCVIHDLPAGLPAKTPVAVTFHYEVNGRLTVRAELPTIGRDAELTIERASGLTENEIDYWQQRIDAGFPDSEVPAPTTETEPNNVVHRAAPLVVPTDEQAVEMSPVAETPDSVEDIPFTAAEEPLPPAENGGWDFQGFEDEAAPAASEETPPSAPAPVEKKSAAKKWLGKKVKQPPVKPSPPVKADEDFPDLAAPAEEHAPQESLGDDWDSFSKEMFG